jgi:hypothetical protein
MPRRTISFDSRIIETIPDPSPSPPELLMAAEEPQEQGRFDIATRLTLALGSLTKLEAWAALAYMSRPGLGYDRVAAFAHCSAATVRRAVAKLRASVSEGGRPPLEEGSSAPPGAGSFETSSKRPRTRRGARAKQTNAKGKK